MAGDLIIGLGTGRCGILALSQFLDMQPGISMLYEGSLHGKQNLFDWSGDAPKVIAWLDELKRSSVSNQLIGDAGSYYLPYVDEIFHHFPETRFICFERHRSEVVRSFRKKTSDNRHFWYTHDGKKYRKDPVWDSKFPKFDVEDKKAAIGLYWDMYHEQAINLARKYPDRFHVFPMAFLNSGRGRAAVLDYIQYRGKRILENDYQDDSLLNKLNPVHWLKKLGLF